MSSRSEAARKAAETRKRKAAERAAADKAKAAERAAQQPEQAEVSPEPERRSATTQSRPAPEPMGAGDPEPLLEPGMTAAERAVMNNARDCYAVETLVGEVTAIWPECSYSVGGPVVYGANTSVTFTGWDDAHDENEPGLDTVLGLLGEGDYLRVWAVTVEEGAVLIEMLPDPVTMDSREPYHLQGAYNALAGVE